MPPRQVRLHAEQLASEFALSAGVAKAAALRGEMYGAPQQSVHWHSLRLLYEKQPESGNAYDLLDKPSLDVLRALEAARRV